MDQILNQLSALLIGSVPTIVLFILLVIAYDVLVRLPLEKVLAERRLRTSGAVEQAQGAIAAAAAETAVYEDKLHAAKTEIYRAREEKQKQWNAEREAALEEIRKTAQDQIANARRDIEQSAAAARQQIEANSEDLSARVLRAVLPGGLPPAEAVQ